MSPSTVPVTELCDPLEAYLADDAWLQSLKFRQGLDSAIKQAASIGEVEAFGKELKAHFKAVFGTRKQLAQRLETAAILSDENVVSQDDLTIPDLSPESGPNPRELCDAVWTLTHRFHDLNAVECTTLWRGLLQAAQRSYTQATEVDLETALLDLPALEWRLLASSLFIDLKGGKKLWRATCDFLHEALATGVDTDGTLHASQLPGSMGLMSTLARISLFTQPDSLNSKKATKAETESNGSRWPAKTLALVESMLDRWASLVYPQGCAFDTNEVPNNRIVAIVNSFPFAQQSGLQRLFANWQQGKSSKSSKISTWSLPEECHQSDWSCWASLRSNWHSPVSQCHVTWHQTAPELHLVVDNTPLLHSAWESDDLPDGSSDERWACTCHFNDEEASFVELQHKRGDVLRTRQLLLLRDEQCLLLADFVQTNELAEDSSETRLNFHPEWTWEEDSTSREAALVSSHRRIRLFPISEPQMKVNKPHGRLSCSDHSLRFQRHAIHGVTSRLLLLDWSSQRRRKPADWSALTVAEDGRIVSPETAIGYRLRVGQSQWVYYHSFQKPETARTVLGIHSNSETVFAEIESDGTPRVIVEVETESAEE